MTVVKFIGKSTKDVALEWDPISYYLNWRLII